MLTSGPRPKVAAIIDWGQAGWYPTYWEYCKTQCVGLPTEMHMDKATQREWRKRYVPLMLDPVDEDKCLTPWLVWVCNWN